jgi:integrase
VPGEGRFQRSTKTTDRRLAKQIAERWESAAHGRLTDIRARQVIAEIYQLRNAGEKLPHSTARQFFSAWAENKGRETKQSTAAKYSRVATQFVSSLGPLADELDVASIGSRHVVAFRDGLTKNVSVSTANLATKVVRMALKDAVSEGLAVSNVAAGVKAAKSNEASAQRRAFTISELKRILRSADGEWRGLILFGLYTGQRLGDVASLTWQNVDLQREELAFVSQKTSRRQLVPIAAPLQKYLEELDASDNPKAPLFPKASAVSRIGTLSNQFYEILADAGLVEKRRHISNGSLGKSKRRKFNELSFHALRHTATSLLKNAGISPAIVQDIIGHESPAISAHYTHIEEDAKRRAISALPDVT